MTKNEEIAALKKFAESLPKDSYLYAAISYLEPQFESDIRSDIISLVEVRGIARDTVEVRQQHREISKLLEEQKQKVAMLKSQSEDLLHKIVNTKKLLAELARSINGIL